ncbi:MAG: hypothetical protein GEV10_01350 [Streptosporangiales bacterium]|nr:hypothetical protein [Streptosporangiales bacterium]
MATVTMDWVKVRGMARSARDSAPDLDSAEEHVSNAGSWAKGAMSDLQSAAALTTYSSTWTDLMKSFAKTARDIGDKLESSAAIVETADTRSAQEVDASGDDAAYVSVSLNRTTWVDGGI